MFPPFGAPGYGEIPSNGPFPPDQIEAPTWPDPSQLEAGAAETALPPVDGLVSKNVADHVPAPPLDDDPVVIGRAGVQPAHPPAAALDLAAHAAGSEESPDEAVGSGEPATSDGTDMAEPAGPQTAGN